MERSNRHQAYPIHAQLRLCTAKSRVAATKFTKSFHAVALRDILFMQSSTHYSSQAGHFPEAAATPLPPLPADDFESAVSSSK